ncbi:hypothetical protein CSC94_05425 [Zhengella mangrovi]|uniref:DUF192 domain-containing protein n=1 Tax=Zhengella mangrovi TaxID=1982044 RepID=A0A2G1QRJ0_9HYPH|nr:DUF192 domain-containing protein [Zhengella mangrovi]PHP68101.1 hypothetical protein CSC94_05425 [Zhengella mangrovi]
MLAPSAPARADSPTGTAEGQGQVLEVHPVPLTVTTEKGSFSFHIEVADEPGERSTGLMFRTAMPDDHGMLFVFQDNIRAAFWMMNTILPLDIIYIREDGTVDSIRRGVPFSLDALRSNGLVRYVLELNAGMAQKAGIRPGVKVVHPLIPAD